MFRVLIITDSLGFPRKTPSAVHYQETYVSLLKHQFPEIDFIHHGRGGGTIAELYDMSSYFHDTLDPDIVFIQSGIVDCAPRALSHTENRLISLLPFVRKPIFFLVRKWSRFLRKVRGISYTSINDFHEVVCKFNQSFSKVYWVEILPASDEYENHLEGVGVNISTFNKVLKRYNYIPTEDFNKEDMLSDFHHLSASGHRKVFERISQVIVESFSSADSNSQLSRCANYHSPPSIR
ncbi:SGNH/GDSL hydrolase family protein [Chromobacterium violaceum]|uniref:SGNH/GDSL hydrolase family protein n=1 Tax=Chromobacterium violaceum TaxID=536 RepID=UPI000ACFAFD3|nr:SGNH/GDSL hydrolase family protein [Chromobacterium violaceum]